MNGSVKAVIDGFPTPVRKQAKAIRALILQTARATEEIGPINETLKWGEPAYLPDKPRTGTTVRIGWKEKHADELKLLFHCQTTLVDSFRTRFPELKYEGNRAICLPVEGALPEAELRECILAALTYHSRR